ncbi:thioredoxin family protein [Intrasporangium calvum]|uniref:Thioredoxin family protein n=1 Tax=Intrasporangium calvum TaxID=53358 RepID=A0ABT5GJU4_9MICO|nr:thioredoxin family protein [Intrasporangium calvum]MDC5698467.1 thioredoxin family protein [Intrasporangium calvum]
MEITLLYFADCPNWKIADERLSAAVSGRADVTAVRRRLVETDEEAERVGFHGSPSIHVDGVDVFAAPGAPVGLACRRYLTADGYEGAPSLEDLRAVLDRRR